MKNKLRLFSSVLASLLLVMAHPALGEGPDQPRETFYSVGYRMWFEKLDHESVSESGFILLHGPVASVSYKNWGLSVAYLTGGLESTSAGFLGTEETFVSLTSNNHREDLDAALSYRVLDFLRPFIGFKYVNYTDTLTAQGPGGTAAQEIEYEYHGPTFGLNVLFRPFRDDRFFVTGTFLYSFMDLYAREWIRPLEEPAELVFSQNISVRMLNSDLALGCQLGGGLTATAGYKYQRVDRNSDENYGPDTIKGPVFALVYSF